jgi:hypothetical protein
VVRIVALALGKVNVLAVVAGPDTVKNALAVPPLAEGRISPKEVITPVVVATRMMPLDREDNACSALNVASAVCVM